MKFVKKTIEQRKEWIEICGNSKPSEEVQNIFWKNSLKPCDIRFLAFASKNKLLDITKRFEIYSSLPSGVRKGNSLEMYQLKHGDEKGKSLYKAKNDVCKHTLDNFIRKYGKREGIKRYKKANSLKTETLENFIRRYGLEIGNEKYKNFCNRNKGNWSLERQVEIHGTQNGANRHKHIINKMKHSRTIEGYCERYGLKKGKKMYYEQLDKLRQHGSYRKNKNTSQISQKLFNEIYNIIKFDYKEIYFRCLNKEYKCAGRYLDFYIHDIKRCIEFNGDKFHANPTIFMENDTPHPYVSNLRSSDLWKMDKVRLEKIQNEGILVLVVWEKEFREKKTETINKCINFIKYGSEN